MRATKCYAQTKCNSQYHIKIKEALNEVVQFKPNGAFIWLHQSPCIQIP